VYGDLQLPPRHPVPCRGRVQCSRRIGLLRLVLARRQGRTAQTAFPPNAAAGNAARAVGILPLFFSFLLLPFLSSFLPLIAGRGCGGFGGKTPHGRRIRETGWGFCRAAGLGFRLQRDGGDRFWAAWHASAGASTVGAAAMGGAACVAPPAPSRRRHGEEERTRRERLWWLTAGAHTAVREKEKGGE
jgi:hypothetical protein